MEIDLGDSRGRCFNRLNESVSGFVAGFYVDVVGLHEGGCTHGPGREG